MPSPYDDPDFVAAAAELAGTRASSYDDPDFIAAAAELARSGGSTASSAPSPISLYEPRTKPSDYADQGFQVRPRAVTEDYQFALKPGQSREPVDAVAERSLWQRLIDFAGGADSEKTEDEYKAAAERSAWDKYNVFREDPTLNAIVDADYPRLDAFAKGAVGAFGEAIHPFEPLFDEVAKVTPAGLEAQQLADNRGEWEVPSHISGAAKQAGRALVHGIPATLERLGAFDPVQQVRDLAGVPPPPGHVKREPDAMAKRTAQAYDAAVYGDKGSPTWERMADTTGVDEGVLQVAGGFADPLIAGDWALKVGRIANSIRRGRKLYQVFEQGGRSREIVELLNAAGGGRTAKHLQAEIASLPLSDGLKGKVGLSQQVVNADKLATAVKRGIIGEDHARTLSTLIGDTPISSPYLTDAERLSGSVQASERARHVYDNYVRTATNLEEARAAETLQQKVEALRSGDAPLRLFDTADNASAAMKELPGFDMVEVKSAKSVGGKPVWAVYDSKAVSELRNVPQLLGQLPGGGTAASAVKAVLEGSPDFLPIFAAGGVDIPGARAFEKVVLSKVVNGEKVVVDTVYTGNASHVKAMRDMMEKGKALSVADGIEYVVDFGTDFERRAADFIAGSTRGNIRFNTRRFAEFLGTRLGVHDSKELAAVAKAVVTHPTSAPRLADQAATRLAPALGRTVEDVRGELDKWMKSFDELYGRVATTPQSLPKVSAVEAAQKKVEVIDARAASHKASVEATAARIEGHKAEIAAATDAIEKARGASDFTAMATAAAKRERAEVALAREQGVAASLEKKGPKLQAAAEKALAEAEKKSAAEIRRAEAAVARAKAAEEAAAKRAAKEAATAESRAVADALLDARKARAQVDVELAELEVARAKLAERRGQALPKSDPAKLDAIMRRTKKASAEAEKRVFEAQAAQDAIAKELSAERAAAEKAATAQEKAAKDARVAEKVAEDRAVAATLLDARKAKARVDAELAELEAVRTKLAERRGQALPKSDQAKLDAIMRRTKKASEEAEKKLFEAQARQDAIAKEVRAERATADTVAEVDSAAEEAGNARFKAEADAIAAERRLKAYDESFKSDPEKNPAARLPLELEAKRAKKIYREALAKERAALKRVDDVASLRPAPVKVTVDNVNRLPSKPKPEPVRATPDDVKVVVFADDRRLAYESAEAARAARPDAAEKLVESVIPPGTSVGTTPESVGQVAKRKREWGKPGDTAANITGKDYQSLISVARLAVRKHYDMGFAQVKNLPVNFQAILERDAKAIVDTVTPGRLGVEHADHIKQGEYFRAKGGIAQDAEEFYARAAREAPAPGPTIGAGQVVEAPPVTTQAAPEAAQAAPVAVEAQPGRKLLGRGRQPAGLLPAGEPVGPVPTGPTAPSRVTLLPSGERRAISLPSRVSQDAPVAPSPPRGGADVVPLESSTVATEAVTASERRLLSSGRQPAGLLPAGEPVGTGPAGPARPPRVTLLPSGERRVFNLPSHLSQDAVPVAPPPPRVGADVVPGSPESYLAAQEAQDLETAAFLAGESAVEPGSVAHKIAEQNKAAKVGQTSTPVAHKAAEAAYREELRAWLAAAEQGVDVPIPQRGMFDLDGIFRGAVDLKSAGNLTFMQRFVLPALSHAMESIAGQAGRDAGMAALRDMLRTSSMSSSFRTQLDAVKAILPEALDRQNAALVMNRMFGDLEANAPKWFEAYKAGQLPQVDKFIAEYRAAWDGLLKQTGAHALYDTSAGGTPLVLDSKKAMANLKADIAKLKKAKQSPAIRKRLNDVVIRLQNMQDFGDRIDNMTYSLLEGVGPVESIIMRNQGEQFSAAMHIVDPIDAASMAAYRAFKYRSTNELLPLFRRAAERFDPRSEKAKAIDEILKSYLSGKETWEHKGASSLRKFFRGLTSDVKQGRNATRAGVNLRIDDAVSRTAATLRHWSFLSYIGFNTASSIRNVVGQVFAPMQHFGSKNTAGAILDVLEALNDVKAGRPNALLRSATDSGRVGHTYYEANFNAHDLNELRRLASAQNVFDKSVQAAGKVSDSVARLGSLLFGASENFLSLVSIAAARRRAVEVLEALRATGEIPDALRDGVTVMSRKQLKAEMDRLSDLARKMSGTDVERLDAGTKAIVTALRDNASMPDPDQLVDWTSSARAALASPDAELAFIDRAGVDGANLTQFVQSAKDKPLFAQSSDIVQIVTQFTDFSVKDTFRVLRDLDGAGKKKYLAMMFAIGGPAGVIPLAQYIQEKFPDEWAKMANIEVNGTPLSHFNLSAQVGASNVVQSPLNPSIHRVSSGPAFSSAYSTYQALVAALEDGDTPKAEKQLRMLVEERPDGGVKAKPARKLVTGDTHLLPLPGVTIENAAAIMNPIAKVAGVVSPGLEALLENKDEGGGVRSVPSGLPLFVPGGSTWATALRRGDPRPAGAEQTPRPGPLGFFPPRDYRSHEAVSAVKREDERIRQGKKGAADLAGVLLNRDVPMDDILARPEMSALDERDVYAAAERVRTSRLTGQVAGASREVSAAAKQSAFDEILEQQKRGGAAPEVIANTAMMAEESVENSVLERIENDAALGNRSTDLARIEGLPREVVQARLDAVKRGMTTYRKSLRSDYERNRVNRYIHSLNRAWEEDGEDGVRRVMGYSNNSDLKNVGEYMLVTMRAQQGLATGAY